MYANALDQASYLTSNQRRKLSHFKKSISIAGSDAEVRINRHIQDNTFGSNRTRIERLVRKIDEGRVVDIASIL